MARLRIVHASDFHIGRTANQIGIPELLKNPSQPISTWATVSSHSDIYADAFAAWVHANANRFDVLLISGDLASTGNPGDLRAAKRYTHSPAKSGYLSARNKPTLQSTNKPICLIPGNHDRFRNLHYPGGAHFHAIFNAAWSAKQGVQTLFSQPRGVAQFVLIGADFSLRRSDWGSPIYGVPLGFFGQGRAYSNRVHQLGALTEQERGRHAECILIWVIHFEPDQSASTLALLDENVLAQELNRLRNASLAVDAILCGHTHRANTSKSFSNTSVYVSGTTTQHASASGNAFIVLDIDYRSTGNLRISPTVFSYDKVQGKFV